jgi:tRNA 2-thiouridine synthesizing protein C
MTVRKRLLLLMRQAPYASNHPAEAAEIALVAGALDMPIALLFQGPGVWQLLSGQDGSAIGTRTLADILAQLPDYEITDLYVCADSMAQFGLTAADLTLPVRPLSIQAQRDLVAGCHVVLND